MDYKEDISRLQGQIENIVWCMGWMLDRMKENRHNLEYEPVTEGLIGLNDTKYELECMIQQMENETRKQAGQV